MGILDNYITVIPDCRYGHGPLALLTYSGGHAEWYIKGVHGNASFHGHVYLCKTCGYTEFFDNELDRTRKEMDRSE